MTWVDILLKLKWVIAIIILAPFILILFRKQIGNLIENLPTIRIKREYTIGKDIVVGERPKQISLDESEKPSESIGTKDIRDLLKESERLCSLAKWESAERILIEKDKEDPKNFDILRALFYLYLDPKCRLKGHEGIIQLLAKKEQHYNDSPEYHRLVAILYMEMRDDMKIKEVMAFPTFDVKNKALNAAIKAIELDKDNPRWYRLKGYIYYWFGDIKEAIKITEKTLKMAMGQKNIEGEIKCKNNLAFYYAFTKDKENEKNARDFSKDAYNHDIDSVLYLDTLGYVKWKFAKDLKELREAADIFESIYKKDPFDTDINLHLTECLQELKIQETQEELNENI